jgi:DNA mismatch repair protein MutS2
MSFKFDAYDLDYKEVLKNIGKYALLPYIKEEILSIEPIENLGAAQRQSRISDAIDIIWKYSDPRERLPELAIGSIEGFKNYRSLSFQHYFGLLLFLKAVYNIREFFLNISLNSNFFYNIASQLSFPVSFFNLLDSVFDDEGNIKDKASSKLYEIRKSIKKFENDLNNLLTNYVRGENKKYFQENIVLERNGFYLLPVKIEHLDRVPGTIRDTSTSGLTAYVEPYISAEIVSKIRLKKEEELNELKLILKNLDKNLLNFRELIQENINFYESTDFFFALGKYAKEYNCVKPELVNELIIEFNNTRHPLLKNPIGQDFFLNNKSRGFVLTGANGGGKSVALKNLGLNVFLALSGLYIHANSAKIGPFKGLYSDLSDVQDLSLGLSTFTYHIDKLKHFLANDLKDSIVLIDELGNGTDPKEGFSLAKSIIKYLLLQGAFICITTHISELKITNIDRFEITIGAMEYDNNSNLPTYRLLWNSIGNSHALDVAKKMGLPLEIISDAKEYLLSDQVYNEMSKLNKLTEFYNKKIEELKIQEKSLLTEKELLEKEYNQLKSSLNKKYDEKILELNEIISSTELVVKELKRNLNQPKKDLMIDSLRRWEELESIISSKVSKDKKTLPNKIRINIGDYVNISTMNISGKLIKKQGNKSLVQTEKSKIWVDNSLLVFAEGNLIKQDKKIHNNNMVIKAISNTGSNFEISVRGMRADEAIQKVEKFIDRSLVSNAPYIRIIHGKGEGILRKLVHEILANHPQVENFGLADPNEGGAGVTIVHFR